VANGREEKLRAGQQARPLPAIGNGEVRYALPPEAELNQQADIIRGEDWVVDARQWPILVVQVEADELTDQAQIEALEATTRLIRGRSGWYVGVIDNGNLKRMTSHQRARQAEYMENHADRGSARCNGSAMVIRSPVARGILNAILWARKPPYPVRVFSRMPAAMRWARARAQRLDIHPPV
jgi:hypothetical protein